MLKTTPAGGRNSRWMRLDQRGQSTIEYLIVAFVLIAALISFPGIYDTVATTMKNKHHSYTFAVAVSDPPRKAFDDTVKADADKIEHIFDVLEEIEDLLRDSIFPDLRRMHLPDWNDIEKFGELIRSLF